MLFEVIGCGVYLLHQVPKFTVAGMQFVVLVFFRRYNVATLALRRGKGDLANPDPASDPEGDGPILGCPSPATPVPVITAILVTIVKIPGRRAPGIGREGVQDASILIPEVWFAVYLAPLLGVNSVETAIWMALDGN